MSMKGKIAMKANAFKTKKLIHLKKFFNLNIRFGFFNTQYFYLFQGRKNYYSFTQKIGIFIHINFSKIINAFLAILGQKN